MFRIFKQFLKEMFVWVKGGCKLSEVSWYRLSICHSCDWFMSESLRCRKCGCHMGLKTKLKTSKCPIKKW